MAASRARSVASFSCFVQGHGGSIEVEGKATAEGRMARRDHYWKRRTADSSVILKELSQLESIWLLEVEGKPFVVPTAVAFMGVELL